jgi:hypothetical protein
VLLSPVPAARSNHCLPRVQSFGTPQPFAYIIPTSYWAGAYPWVGGSAIPNYRLKVILRHSKALVV